jgi:hypothetical protein
MDTPTATAKHSVAAALLALSLSLVACSGDSSPAETPAPQGNMFVNPGFEAGSDPWFSLSETANFVHTEERAHGGVASAHLRMRDPLEAQGAKVYYLIQEITPSEFPEVLKGFYRVENWKKETPKQYLQFVVIAFEPKNFPTTVSNWQIRYLLAGIDNPPFPIGNAHFVFVSREEPVQNQWVHFERNIKEDFERLWDRVPEDFEKIRILFEVRWDDKVAGEGAPEADVYYDDLYVGPASSD